MRTVLVTGGAGYVGAHACKALSKAGWQPVVFDNLSNGHEDFAKWGPLHVGDITIRQDLVDAFERYRPAAVMHFAAYAYVGESIRIPHKYFRNNVHGSLELLDVMKQFGVRNIVFSSSCATYGVHGSDRITETSNQQPISPYGHSKLMAEEIIKSLDGEWGLKSAILRYFNAAGADPDGEIGEFHNPETHIVPLAIEAAAEKSCVFSVFGNDYPTPDGTCIRDFVHVSDLADAHVAALSHVLERGQSDAFNLGTGIGHSVRQVLDATSRVVGTPVKARNLSRRPGDAARLVADATKARKVLGWEPRYRDLGEIIETAWQWYRAPQAVAVA